MKLENLTSLQTQLFKLPVVFTECAWYEAVYLEQPASFGDLGSRLGDTLEAAYTRVFPPGVDKDQIEILSERRYQILEAEGCRS